MAQYGFGIGSIDASSYPNISVKIRCVYSNSLIQNLSSNQFILTEDSVQRQVTVQCPDRKQYNASVAFGIDRSMGSKVQNAKLAADSMLRRFRFPNQANDEVAVWSFASFPNKDLAFNQNILTIRQTINSITEAQFPFNGTSLYETMHRAIEDVNEFGRNIPKAIIFFTDGVNHTRTYSRTLDEVRIRANISSIKIYVVGMAAPPDGESAMRNLCEGTGGFFVPNASPQALDSIYIDLTSEPVSQYFCTLNFTTTNCPDGSQHRIQIKYIPTSIDTLMLSTSYSTPRIESQLKTIEVWVSPDSIERIEAGKPVSLAFGLHLQEPTQISEFEFLISHPLSLIFDSCSLDTTINTATYQIRSVSNGSQIRITGINNILPRGEIRLGLLHGVVLNTSGLRSSFALISSKPGCIASKQISVSNRTIQLSIDTVLGVINRFVSVPIRLTHIENQEGLQRLQIHLSIPTKGIRIDSSIIFTLNDSLHWKINNISSYTDASETRLSIDCAGPALLSCLLLGNLNLFVDPSVSIRTIIRFDQFNQSSANVLYFPKTILHVYDGMIVLRDTCRVDRSIMRVPFNEVRQNIPNPFSAGSSGNQSTTIPLILAQDEFATMTLFDLLGRNHGIIFEGLLNKGLNNVLFESTHHTDLQSGMYILSVQTKNWVGSIKMILQR